MVSESCGPLPDLGAAANALRVVSGPPYGTFPLRAALRLDVSLRSVGLVAASVPSGGPWR